METLHTTGDWYAKDGQIVAQDTGKTLAVIPYYDNTDEEQTANANLMAAAPKMINDFKRIVLLINESETYRELKGNEVAVREIAEQAIQQATNP